MIVNTNFQSHQMGTLPDKYWNQLNGRSASENYADFKQSQFQNTEAEEEPEFHITFEVKKK